MPIHFTCPHCGAQTEVSDEYAGQSGPCAQCGQKITVPPRGSPPAFATVPKRSNTSWIVLIVVLVAALPVLIACAGILIALLLPAVQASREAARRAACLNNLKQIGVAMHMYHEKHGSFPPAYLADESGRPMHGWRVLILPYLEHEWLYEMYKFDEPWDGPNNRALADLMPDVFRCPSAIGTVVDTETSYAMIVGPGAISDGPTATQLSQIRDGTPNTAMVVEVCGAGINWLEPRDCDVAENGLLINDVGGEGMQSSHPGVVNVLFCDGSVRSVNDWIDRQLLQAITSIAGGEEADVSNEF